MPYADSNRLTPSDKKSLKKILSMNEFKAIDKLFQWKRDVLADKILQEAEDKYDFAMKYARIVLSETLGHIYQFGKDDKEDMSDLPAIKKEASKIFTGNHDSD